MSRYVRYIILTPEVAREELESKRQEFIRENADEGWKDGPDGRRPLKIMEGVLANGYDRACACIERYAVDHGHGYDDLAIRFRDACRVETYETDPTIMTLMRRMNQLERRREGLLAELRKYDSLGSTDNATDSRAVAAITDIESRIGETDELADRDRTELRERMRRIRSELPAMWLVRASCERSRG